MDFVGKSLADAIDFCVTDRGESPVLYGAALSHAYQSES